MVGMLKVSPTARQSFRCTQHMYGVPYQRFVDFLCFAAWSDHVLPLLLVPSVILVLVFALLPMA